MNNKSRKTSHISNIIQFDADGHVVIPASLTLGIAPGADDNSAKVPSTAWVRGIITTAGGGYVPTGRTITINGVSYDLSANRAWSIDTGVLSATAGAGISVSTVSQNLNIVNTGLLSGTAGAGISVSTINQNLNIVNTGLLSATSGAGISVSTVNQNLNIVNTGLLSATAGSGITVSTVGQNLNIVNTGILTATAGAGISISVVGQNLNIVNTITDNNQLANGAGYATSSYVTTQINNLVSGAPGLLDTLDELAAALGDDPNFATTITTALSNRLRVDTATQGLTSTQQSNGRTNLGLGSLATLSSIGNAYITDLAWSKITGAPSFLTAEADTLSTVVARGNTTSTYISVDYIITTNNGNGTNVRIGDDLWMGDVNLANTVRFMGVQNNANAYIIFGNGDTTALGRAGTGALTYGGNTVYHSGNLTNLNQLTNGPGYITGNQNITLSGDVTGSGATSIVTTIANNAITTAKINNGAITAAKLAILGAGEGISWAANTDGASIIFESTSDGASGGRALSNLLIALTDNGDEGLKVTSAGTELFYVNTNQLQYKGNTIWHSANDGSGSGLDADLLDGINSGSFLRSDVVDATVTGTILSTNNANVDGPNFEVNTTNKTVNEYAYQVSRSGSAVGGILIDGRGVFASGTTIAGNTAYHSGNLTNLNQLTNGPGYITGYTETDTLQSVVSRGRTAAVGFTTYTGDGLFDAGASPVTFSTPHGSTTRIGYHDAGGGQYAPAIGFLVGSSTHTGFNAIRIRISGEGNDRFSLQHSGQLNWGPGGSTGADTNLYRDSANVLKTDDAFYAVGSITTDGNIYVSNNGGRLYFDRPNGATVGAVGWHTNDVFYLGGHPDYGPGAGNAVRVYGFGGDLSFGSANAGDVITINNSGTINTNYTIISSGGSGTTPTLVLNRNIATPSNYYNGLQLEIRATSGTAGIGLHRNGYSHVGIYHDAANSLKFDMNAGTVTLNHNTGTVWGTGNLTNLNQLANGPGYITGYTETDTLATVTGRGASTSSDLTFNGTLTMGTGGTQYIRMGRFPASTTNTGEAWIGRASDRSVGTMTVQLGNATGTIFEVVDYAWSTVVFSAGMNNFTYKNNTIYHSGNLTNLNQLTNGPGYITSSALSSYLPLSGGTMTGQLTITGARLLVQTGGADTYGIVSGYNNNNHLMTMRGQITGSTSSPTVTGAHQMTFVEYAENNDSTGWFFKSSQPGTYTEVARITRSGINWNGNIVLHSGNYNSYSPTLTGGNASGTWAISITGGAASANLASNSNQLGGYSLQNVVPYHSGSDFADGTLVVTNINAAVTYGDSFVMEVTGKSYGSGPAPFGLLLEGYIYADTFINVGAISYGSWFPGPIRILNYGGNLAFWWPRGSYWNSFSVSVREAGGSSSNRVTSIGNSTEPASSKKVSVGVIQSLNSNNYGSYALPLTGGTVTGATTFSSNVNANGTYFNVAGYIDLSGVLYLRSNVNYLNASSNGWNTFLARNGESFDGYFTRVFSTSHISSTGGNLHTNRGRVAFSSTAGDANHSIYNNYNNIDGEGSWDGMKMNVYNGLDVRTGAFNSSTTALQVRSTGISVNALKVGFRNGGATEFIQGEAWTMGIYGYNSNDGFLFYQRDTTDAARPCFHIGGWNNAGYGGYSNADSMITLVRGDGTKSEGTAYADKGLSNSSYYTNIIKTSSETVFRDAQGRHKFTGRIILGTFPNSTTNTGEAWIGRASDRNAGTMTVQLGGNSASSREFEVVDYAWSVVLFKVGSNGNVVASGDITAYSDVRVKENIKEITDAVNKVKSIRGVTFNRTDIDDKNTRHAGVIAQEVMEVLPEVVSTTDKGLQTVAYGNMTALLIEAIKEQQKQIEELKTKLDGLTK